MPSPSPDPLFRPNWFRIAAFTGVGVLLLVIAYFWDSSYAQGVLVNGGTALLLFALLVFAEPGLARRVDEALRQPATLAEAQSRVAARLVPTPVAGTQAGSGQQQLVGRVLAMVSRAGLVAQQPVGSSVRFRSRGGAPVDWWVQWDDQGVRHSVTVSGFDAAPDLATPVSPKAGVDEHEQRVLQILCRLLRALDDPGGPTRRRRRSRRPAVPRSS